ncbi:MAG: hypothetical protein SGJ10_14115 [Bacteroidota bacterium]|nr:hypothetical protein [Bacteroidota bacterium]
MRNIKIKFSLATCFTLLVQFANAQGCSDAGFCTLNSFKPNSLDSIDKMKNQFKIGVSFGKADYAISTFGNYLEYNRILNNKFSIDVKLTSLLQQGNNVLALGLSDIYLNANYKIAGRTRLTFGTKIPLTNGNQMKANLSLPMDYQSSLGTYDLTCGIGYEIKNIQLVAALQQPLTQNSNGFIAESYPVNSALRAFQSTNKFKRSGDVLFRVSYPIMLGKKMKLTPSLLSIYHLSTDKFTDALGIVNDIKGSEGLTLNGNVYFDYDINKSNLLQLNLGVPFVVRDTRPDGLTRSFIVNLEYRIKF